MMKRSIIGIVALTIFVSACNQPAENEATVERVAKGDQKGGQSTPARPTVPRIISSFSPLSSQGCPIGRQRRAKWT